MTLIASISELFLSGYAVVENYCASSPCLNGGNCSNTISYYTCECIDGWNGANCENRKHACFTIQNLLVW